MAGSGGEGGVSIGGLVGDFRVLRELGEGGMGVVYLARDERLERRVALKVIAPLLARDAEFRHRFIAEARHAAALDHPNVVTVYSSGTADDQLYIAMRYVEGTDLRQLLADQGRLDAHVAVTIVADVAAALDTAHSSGMVHRDVKPGNILIEGEPGTGGIYLTDFGLTKGEGDGATQLTGTGQWVGTIDYVAPEQIQGGRIDARTDVYALGCVLYESLCGKVPYPGNDMQKMWGHVNEPFPALRSPGDGLDAVVQRATAKNPEDRFPSAGDLARAATAAAEGYRVREEERSVATGPAADGLLEPGASAAVDQARTVTGRAPLPRRDAPTTKMPPGPAGEPHRRASDPPGSARVVAAGSAVAIVCAVLIGAAILITGSDSSGGTGGQTVRQKGKEEARNASAGAGSSAAGNADSPEPTQGAATDTDADQFELGSTEDWAGGSAYSAMLGAFSNESGARTWQQRALDRDLEAGVLYSSNFASLNPGYWVVFSGSFSGLEEADERAAQARALDFPGSYAKLVAP